MRNPMRWLTTTFTALTLAAPGALALSQDVAQDDAFGAVLDAFEEDFEAWQAETQTAIRAWNKERDSDPEAQLSLPDHPAVAHYAAFREVADSGSGEAKLWCLEQFAHAKVPAERAAVTKLRIYLDLLDGFAAEPWIATLARSASHDSGKLLSLETSLGLLAELREMNPNADVRGDCLYYKAACLRGAGRGEQSLVALKEMIAEYPDHERTVRAAGQVFRTEHLQVGMTPPDFTTQDIDGNEMKLSDYRGRVTVLDFWGFW
jgi:hypothetical protein